MKSYLAGATRLPPPLLACLALVAAAHGCARKAPIKPPEDVRPSTIRDLAAVRTEQGAELSWRRPSEYVDGSRMTDLDGFQVQRQDGDNRGEFRTVAVVHVTDRDRFRQAKKFRYLDREIRAGCAISYRVVSFTLDGYFSAPSNVVTLDTTTPETGEPHAPLPATQR